MKSLLTDVDSVLLDYETAFECFLSRNGYGKIPNSDHIDDFSIRYRLSNKVIKSLINEFNTSDDFGQIAPYKDSVEHFTSLVKNIKSNNKDTEVIAITSCGTEAETQRLRIKNMTSVFGDIFSEVIFLPANSNKRSELAKWAYTGHLWIEDNATNAVDGHELGLRTVIVDRPYNRHIDHKKHLIFRTSYASPWKCISQYYNYLEGFDLV